MRLTAERTHRGG